MQYNEIEMIRDGHRQQGRRRNPAALLLCAEKPTSTEQERTVLGGSHEKLERIL